MALEEKLRAYAAKGELVHLSLVSTGGGFQCVFAAATPAGGYAYGNDHDPVEAIEKALKASPAKPARQHVSSRKHDPVDTADVKDAKEGALSREWTTP